MTHIRKFLSYRENKNSTKIVKESVLQVDDAYKVRVIVDVKKSMVNSYIKKVSDNTQKNLRDFYSDMDIVEELVKHVVESGMNVDTIPATLLVGGSQTQAQPAQSQQAQVQTQPAQEPAQDFEEVQSQGQPQGQPESLGAQSGQGQVQPQDQNQGQAPQEEEEEEDEELPR
jgi:hypothetical protein